MIAFGEGEEKWFRQKEQEQRLLSSRLLLFPNPPEVQGPKRKDGEELVWTWCCLGGGRVGLQMSIYWGA